MAELYHFYTNDENWLYSNGRQSVTVGSGVYEPLPITRSGWSRKLGEMKATIEMPDDVEPAASYALRNPNNPVRVRVIDESAGSRVIFWGKVVACELEYQRRMAKLSVSALDMDIEALIPRENYSAGCNWTVFDSDCALSPDAFAVSLPVADSTIVSTTIEHPDLGAFADDYFSYGMAQCGLIFVLIIDSVQATDTLTLLHPFRIFPESIIKIFPGCDGARTTCETKFNNLVNFFGFPFISHKNPVSDSIQ